MRRGLAWLGWERGPDGRPVYPGLRRTVLGALVVLLTVVGLDAFSAHVLFVPNLGLPCFVALVLVAAWAGLPAAFLGVGVLVAHAWIVYHYAVSPYGPSLSIYGRTPPNPDRDVRGTAVGFAFYAAVVGLVHLALFRAAGRTFDAQRSAREAEAERQDSEEMRRLVVDASTDAVAILDSKGRIVHWNPHAQTLLGLPEQEALGRTLAETILPPHLVGPHLRAQLETGGGPRLEARVRTRDGDEIDVEASVVRRDGATVLFLHDIGERKRTEEAIRDLNARLEERVAERTARLEEANAELSAFNHSVSHDLRAPLRSIVANSHLLAEDAGEALDEESRARLARVEESARRMARQIDRLLGLAHVGQAPLRPREVDLSAVALRHAAELRDAKGGEATVSPDLRAWADPDLIDLVVANLLDNAWKYVREGEAPQVEVGRTPEGAFFVRDRGVGFDMKDAESLWEPFVRLHKGYDGTGVGLANCRRIVQRHGGQIWAESKPGAGAVFFFTLPYPP